MEPTGFSRHPYAKTELEKLFDVPCFYTVYRLELDPSRFREDVHPFWEVAFAEQKGFTIARDGVISTVKEGEVIFYPPNVRHVAPKDNSTPTDNIVDILTFTCDSPELYRVAEVPRMLNEGEKSLLLSIVRDAQFAMEPIAEPPYFRRRPHVGKCAPQKLRNKFELFLLSLYERIEREETGNRSNAENRNGEIADKAFLFLRNHLCEEITASQVAHHVGLSPSRLRELFRRRYGCGLVECFNDLKIEEAKNLIRRTSMTFSEISDRLGFSSPQYFTRLFRKKVGVPPSVFAQGILSDGGSD